MKAAKVLLVLLVITAVALVFSAKAQESITQRQARVEGMTDEQKRALSEEWERFNELTPEKRREVCDLHSQLETDPKRESLETVLSRYHKWVETLPWYTRAELQDLSTEERLKRVRELRDDEYVRTLAPADQKVVLGWVMRQFQRVGADISRKDIEQLSNLEPHERQERLRGYFRKYGSRMFDRKNEKDRKKAIAELRGELSPRVRKVMERKNEQDQGRLVFHWMMMGSSPRRRPPFGGPDGKIDANELQHFFLKSLPADERERLLALPSDAMKRELRRIYWQRRSGRSPGRSSHDFRGPRRDGRGPMGRGEGGHGGRREGGRGEGRGPFGPPRGDRSLPEPPPAKSESP